MVRIRHLFISPGHNYFGHHGRSPSTHATVEVDELDCIAGRGIRGDRFLDFKDNYKGQITFFALEVFNQVNSTLGLTGISPGVTRRNVITEGMDLNDLIGSEFDIQGIRFQGIEECRPCYWMNTSFGHKDVETLLRGNGGLRARILSNGTLRMEQ